MINAINGVLITKHEHFLYVQNNYTLREIYVYNPDEYQEGDEYEFFYYRYSMMMPKKIEIDLNVGFQKLEEVIWFKELIMIPGIGMKTAMKMILKGCEELKTWALDQDLVQIMDFYKLNETISENIIQYYAKNIHEQTHKPQIMKINEAINHLTQLGYHKNLASKVVWKYKNEIIKHSFNEVFPALIQEIKYERSKSQTQ